MRENLLRFVFVIAVAIPFLFAGCSGGGGGGDSSSPDSSGSKYKIGTIAVPARSSVWYTIADVTAGGGTVNEFVFDGNLPVYIDAMKSGDTTFFEYDDNTSTISQSESLPGSLWKFYNGVVGYVNYTAGLVAPIWDAYSSHYPSGDYKFKITNPMKSDASVDVYKIQKQKSDFSTGTLDVNLIVYTAGEDNAVIPNADEGQNIKTYMNKIFNQTGISVGNLSVEFLDDADAIASVTDDSSMQSFLISASKGTGDRTDKGINCFLLPILPGDTLGMDGAIPGPGFLHGMAGSGVIAQAAPYDFAASGYTAHQTDQYLLSKILAHEIGHYMGLSHTTESSGKASTPITDTPVCGTENDKNGDGRVSGSECKGKGSDYLMFWVADFDMVESGNFQTKLSGQEGQLVNYHPSVQ